MLEARAGDPRIVAPREEVRDSVSRVHLGLHQVLGVRDQTAVAPRVEPVSDVQYPHDWPYSIAGADTGSIVQSGAVDPRVSVVAPTYRRRDALPQFIEPLLAQEEVYELVMAVDGSDDGSVE